jgi:anti-sigma factor RsiW
MRGDGHPDAELKALSAALHELYDPVLAEPVPERLQAAAKGPRTRPVARAAALLATGLAIGALAGWQLRGERAPVAPAPAFVRSAAIAHATYAPEVRHPVEVGADQETHLVNWLSRRLGAPVRAPKLEEVGYSLVGGRLLPGDSGPVAQFMYQCSAGTRVTLYVRADARESRETALRYRAEGDVRLFYWMDRQFGYALASADIGRDGLQTVAEAAHRQLSEP